MKILALETSTEYCSAALWLDGPAGDRVELAGQRHSELLLPMIDRLLRDANLKLSDMDGIAFGAGPGSFTGVRIACGVAQGLALGANLPVAGVCTLEAVAHASGQDRVIVALDARMAEIYHAAYEKHDDAWQAVCAPSLCLPDHAPRVQGTGWLGAGSGFNAHGDALRACYAENLAGIDVQAVPLASAIAALAAPLFAAGKGVNAADALPLYLRDKVAIKTSERAA